MSDKAPPREVVVQGSARGLVQEVVVGEHRLASDEPVAEGGTNQGPNPYDLLLAALGSCTSMTLSLYARHKEWPLETVRVRLRHTKVPAPEGKAGLVDRIERDIEITGPLDLEQRDRLLGIANKCPIHRTLMSDIQVDTRLV